MLNPSAIKALFFDVFGTVVDWRTSIARESEGVLKPMGYALDWLAFADAWRDEYPWDAIVGAELAGDYKPKPRVYLRAAEAFDCAPSECVMVAAHSGDLAAAAGTGLKTAHVARLNEHGPGKGEPKPTVPVDIAVSSFIELADKLGA